MLVNIHLKTLPVSNQLKIQLKADFGASSWIDVVQVTMTTEGNQKMLDSLHLTSLEVDFDLSLIFVLIYVIYSLIVVNVRHWIKNLPGIIKTTRNKRLKSFTLLNL